MNPVKWPVSSTVSCRNSPSCRKLYIPEMSSDFAVLGAGEEICARRVEQTNKETTKTATAFIPVLEHENRPLEPTSPAQNSVTAIICTTRLYQPMSTRAGVKQSDEPRPGVLPGPRLIVTLESRTAAFAENFLGLFKLEPTPHASLASGEFWGDVFVK